LTSTVCPHLKTEEEGQFKCMVLGSIIDPLALPCLSRYWECPYYLQALREKELREAEVVPEEKPVEKKEEAVEVAREEAEVVEEFPVTMPTLLMEKELEERVERIFRDFKVLDEYWSRYEKEAKRVLESWERVRDSLVSFNRTLNNLIETIEVELKEIELRRSLGLIDEDQYMELKSKLEEKINKYREELERLENTLTQAERKALEHQQRAFASAPLIRTKLKLGLTKLENMFKEGKISEGLFIKLKDEITKALGEGVEQGGGE